MSNFYPVSSLIGGGSGALDALVHTNADGFGTPLATGDIAIVGSLASPKIYRYDSTDTTPENSPHVIEPDSGGGAWTCVSKPPGMNNLIRNSGFSCWSTGTAKYDVYACVDDFTSDIDDWVASGAGGTTLAHDAGTGKLVLNPGGALGAAYREVTGLTIGKLYRLGPSASVVCATAGKTARIGITNSTGATWLKYEDLTTGAGTTVALTAGLFLLATETTCRILFQNRTDTTQMKFDNVDFYEYDVEVTGAWPGPDGWDQTPTLNTRRRWAADFNMPGMYCLQQIASGGSEQSYFPKTGGTTGGMASPAWLAMVRGRTVTVGAWCRASVANHARIRVGHTSNQYSPYHSGSDSPEWLEVTTDVPDSATSAFMSLLVQTTSTTEVYWSQPMMVLGDHIGAGNYQPIPGENLDFDNTITGYPYPGGTLTAATPYPFNIEEMTEGKIGAVKGFFGRIVGIAGTAGKFFGIRQSAAVTNYGMLTSAVNTTDFTLAAGRQILQPNGVFEVFGQTALTTTSVVFTGAVLQ